ncbi:hypothetical protein NBRC116602_02700 [Hyphomicrobiales bacterium 4NK60-0047b]
MISSHHGVFSEISFKPNVASSVGAGERPKSKLALMFGPSINPMKGRAKTLSPIKIFPVICSHFEFRAI